MTLDLTPLPHHKDVFPDDVLARVRDLEQRLNAIMDTLTISPEGEPTIPNVDDHDVEGGTIISYDGSTGMASVLLDNGETVDATILPRQ